MKPRRSVILPLLIGLVLIVFAITVAQTSQQTTNQKKQADSCCAMDLCCCHGGSCDMKESEKTDSAKHCCGDSCDMKMKHDAKNHAGQAACCCCGDSCDMKAHADSQDAAAKPACCSVQMAGNTTAKHDLKNMKNHDVKNHDMKNGCCCCSDSCEMKPTQSGF